MKKALTLLLLLGMVCLSFAVPLKVDPGTVPTVSQSFSFAEILGSQAMQPIIGLTLAVVVSFLLTARRKPKSPLLRLRTSFGLLKKSFVDIFENLLFAYRAKSTWLKRQGNNELPMIAA